jgi:NitT/TauT family transport system substrate-binding protein
MKWLLLVLVLSTAAFANTKVKLGLNWKAEPEFGGFYAAKELGLYEKAGLDVEIIEGAAGVPIAQMVASGQVDFGVTSGDHLILTRSNGADIKALFTVYQKSPQCVMVREDSSIKSFKELMDSDLTLSATSGSLWLTYLQKKFPPKKLKIVPYQGGITAFLNDPKMAQQGFAGSEPQLAESRGVKTRTLLIADAGFDNYAAILFASAKTLKDKPEVAKKFVAATREGWIAYVKDPSAAHKVISHLNPSMDPTTIETVFKIQKPLMVGDSKKGFGALSEKRWEILVKQMVEAGLIKKPVQAKDLFINL